MSWYDGVPASSLYIGPPQDYPAAAAASSAAQSLQTGATGGFSQASIPAGWAPMNSGPRALFGHLSGKVTGQASATTAIWTIGLVNSSGSISGTTLVATPALTVTSFSNGGWEIDFKVLVKSAGYGTTTVSSSLLSTATATASGNSTNLTAQAAPTAVTTIDLSVTQWLYVTVTFSTASATNSCTMQEVILWGMS